MESQSDHEPFWLVRVVTKHRRLSEAQSFSNWGAEFDCAAGAKAVEVTKLMPSSPAAHQDQQDQQQHQQHTTLGGYGSRAKALLTCWDGAF